MVSFLEPVSEHVSNYDAEIAAIEIALDYINASFHTFPSRNQSIAIFIDSPLDSLSAFQDLENNQTVKEECRPSFKHTHELYEYMGDITSKSVHLLRDTLTDQ